MLNVGSDRSRQRATEDYVKAIAHLSERSAVVRAADVARYLKISPASVSQFRSVLEEAGIVETVERGAGVQRDAALRLTPAGSALAIKMARRHGLIESFLHASLAVPIERVHAEAERLEHVISDDVVERLAAFIGDPPAGPLGHPIPRRGGDGALAAATRSTTTPLNELPIGASFSVASIDDDDPEAVKMLVTLGFVPGFSATLAGIDRSGDLRLRNAGTGFSMLIEPSIVARVQCLMIAHESTPAR